MEKDCEADPAKVFNTHPAKVFVEALEALDKLVAECFVFCVQSTFRGL